jgi:hypothetical protein
MSDPRNVAHAKKVTQEKKHQGADAQAEDMAAVQPGKKPAAARKKGGPATELEDTTAAGSASPSDAPAPKAPAAALEGSWVVLSKLKELEFHSRTSLERLAELAMTVEDELKQKDFISPLAEIYSAQSGFDTKLTALIEAYKAECDRMQGESA